MSCASSDLKENERRDSEETAQSLASDVERLNSKVKEALSDPHFVDFSGPDDPEHPHNWSIWLKVWITFMLAVLNLVITIASSIFGSGQGAIAEDFGVSEEVTILGTTLFLIGYVVGPPFFGPLSEKFGRKYPLVIGVSLCGVFSIMPALGKNLATIMLGRFFSGAFAVAAIAVLGGVITDCWNARNRGAAMAACLGFTFSGPSLGPIIGNFVAASSLGWRWNMWILLIIAVASSAVTLITVPETYPPVILQAKSKRLRKERNDEEYRCKFDEESTAIAFIAHVYLVRPWRLFFTEPILVLITLYQAFIYGLLYLFYQAYPIAFYEVRQWELGVSALPLIGVILGTYLGAIIVVVYNNTRYRRLLIENNGVVVPEHRLPLMIFGGCLVPIGLFWFGWTSDPNVPWPSMVCAGIPMGLGMYTIFVQCFMYIIDCYTSVANSALAANGVIRSLFGAGFPLFAVAMYHNLGVAWASSLLGFLSIALAPVPVLFWFFGARIRAWSKGTQG